MPVTQKRGDMRSEDDEGKRSDAGVLFRSAMPRWQPCTGGETNLILQVTDSPRGGGGGGGGRVSTMAREKEPNPKRHVLM